ncbi:MAG: site-specific integrase [Rivularia sp. ALOHA_DT_140]|nr:site-specific integrase [Rivularia sp. ALOHA_DT_140]
MELAFLPEDFHLNKQEWMARQLHGYWSEDKWKPKNSPLLEGELKYPLPCLHFDRISSWKVRTEIKYACYFLSTTGKWSFKRLHASSTFISRIAGWLNELKPNLNSLVELEKESGLISLTSYLIANGIYKRGKTKSVVNSSGELCEYEKDDECIFVLKTIYKTLEGIYDERDEFEKDIWEAENIPNINKGSSYCPRIYFTKISQKWLKIAAKKFIKYQLNKCVWHTCVIKLNAFIRFSKFLKSEYPGIKPCQLNRAILLAYISHVSTLKGANNTRFRYITDVRQFLSLCAREDWLEVPKKELIYDDDLPKWQRLKQPRYIPEEVLNQLNQHLNALPKHLQRLILVLQECGMRIGEVCSMPFDCLLEGENNSFLLRYYIQKMKKEHTIPISDDLVKIIKIQQQYVTQEWGKNFPYLFPTPKPRGKGKPIAYTTVLHRINKLAYEKNICDSAGNFWRFQLHQFRHTVGTSMINKGVPQYIIQRYLGHESPEMTQTYAHIHDQTLRKEIEKYHESRVVNFQGEAAELSETTLSSSNDLEWFKKNVQGRALEHGYCARPKVLGDCDIPGFDGCYNCPHWRTNKNFLPILKDTLERTNNVLEKAKNCGWELQVHKNTPIKNNLEKVIKTLEEDNDQQEN